MDKFVTVGVPNCKKILILDGLNVVLKPCEPRYEYRLRKHLDTSTFIDLEKRNVVLNIGIKQRSSPVLQNY